MSKTRPRNLVSLTTLIWIPVHCQRRVVAAAAGQGYWTVISRIAVILSRFRNGYYCGFLPEGRDLTRLPDIVKGTEENLVVIQAGALKIGNVFCQGQLQCREIY